MPFGLHPSNMNLVFASTCSSMSTHQDPNLGNGWLSNMMLMQLEDLCDGFIS
jgi:hypothetical protein